MAIALDPSASRNAHEDVASSTAGNDAGIELLHGARERGIAQRTGLGPCTSVHNSGPGSVHRNLFQKNQVAVTFLRPLPAAPRETSVVPDSQRCADPVTVHTANLGSPIRR